MSEKAGFYECPLDSKRFTSELSFTSHLGNHVKKHEIDRAKMTEIRSRVLTPSDDPLRDFVTRYAKALPMVSQVKPKRNDAETISTFVTQVCNERGIQLVCPHCGEAFIPKEIEKNG